MKKSTSKIIAWVVPLLSLFIFSSTGVYAQQQQSTIEQQGNIFVQKKTVHSGQIIKTQYVYEDSKGNRDTIYLSSTGKAFVFKVSKNGNIYKKYLPEVTRKINPQAYDDKTESKSSQRSLGQ